MEIQRLVWADSLRGILIMLVVLGHAIDFSVGSNGHLWNYISSFHVPAFMAVSGYLNCRVGGGNNRLSVVIKRTKQLLLPCLLWSLIKVLIYNACSLQAYLNIVLFPDRYFWFLWVLYFIQVFFTLGVGLAERIRVNQALIIGFMCLLFVLIMVVTELRILGYQFFSFYFMFYSMGYFLHKYGKFVPQNKLMIFLLTISWGFLGWYWKMSETPSVVASVNLPSTLVLYSYRFVTAVLAVFVLFASCPYLLNKESKLNQPFIELGKISLGIYVTHLMIIKSIIHLFETFVTNQILVVFLSFCTSLAIAWIVVWLLSRYRITKKVLLGKL